MFSEFVNYPQKGFGKHNYINHRVLFADRNTERLIRTVLSL